MKKNYSKPIALMETFTPNQFVASCTPEIHKEYQVDPKALVQGVHVKYDIGQDGVYNSEDHSQQGGTSNTYHGTTAIYIGKGWGDPTHHGQITWPDPPKTEAEMAVANIQLIYLFVAPETTVPNPIEDVHDFKVYGGKEIDKIIVNMS